MNRSETSQQLLRISSQYVDSLINFVKTVPGGAILIRYIQHSYKDDPIRSIIELGLILFALRYYFSKKTSPDSKAAVPLSNKEVDEICKAWKPEPLVKPLKPSEYYKLKRIPNIKGGIGKTLELAKTEYVLDDYSSVADNTKINVQSKNLTDVLNLSSVDFLNMGLDKRLLDVAANVIKDHGVGACGPPGFFGNQDIHIFLEKRLAKWFNTEDAIIYGQDFCTAVSVLPSFLKRGDIAIVDGGVCLAIQKGLVLSRCQVIYYRHNDLDHLVDILEELQDELKEIKPLNRRYIVTEGLFEGSGDIPDLKRLVDIKEKYKFRLFLDESLSVGVLGRHGRGLTDLYDVPAAKVDIIVGSLANSLASSGGFCVGAKPMVFNQRIASAAYCFSASLPPYSAKVSTEMIDILDTDNSLVSALKKITSFFYKEIAKNNSLRKYVKVVSNELSPLVLIEFTEDIKKQLGLKKYYINTENKFATIYEKSLKSYEDSINETGESNKISKKSVLKTERVDYYSLEAENKRKQNRLKRIMARAERTEHELFNLEEFLITKISNDLLVVDKIMIVANQDILSLEMLRVYPYFKIFLNKDLTEQDILNVIEKFAFHVDEVVNKLTCIEDLEALNEQ